MRRFMGGLALAAVMVGAGGSTADAQTSWDNGAGTFLWGDFNNWSPNGNPNGDAVAIGSLPAAANDTTLIDAVYVIQSLTITNGADVINSPDGGTTDFELEVVGATIIADAGSSFTVYGGNPNGLDTGTLEINNGADLILNSQEAAGLAVVEVDNGVLTNSIGGLITGNGRIDLERFLVGTATLLNNEGTLTATHLGIVLGQPPASTLRITALDADARVDLDGAGNLGVVNVNSNATLDVDVPLSEGFSGDLNLAAGATLDVASAWGIADATVDVNTPGAIVGTGGPAAHLAGGPITMNGGTITLNDSLDALVVDAEFAANLGAIVNEGSITFNAPASIGGGVNFDMIGADAKLVVNATVNIDVLNFNLDGDGLAGNVTTINAGGNLDLDLGAGADENFDHTINLNGGELDVTTADNTWAIINSGVINAGGAAMSTINGETFQIAGTGAVNVATNAGLNVNATTQITGATDFTIAAGGELNFATVTYGQANATFTGDGILRKGTATIAAPTTWNVAVVDLDDGTTTLNEDLTILATAIEDAPDDGLDAVITISDTRLLTVIIAESNSWTVDNLGVINYNGDATADSYLAGSDVAMNGTINHAGDGRIDARLDIGATGVINIYTAGEVLRLGGGNVTDDPNTIAGGVINGPGILRVESGSSLRGFGTINATINFVENADLFADNGTLTIAGAILDINIFGVFADGVANVTNPWNTDSVGGVSMFGGELTGAQITNDGGQGIGGRGLISARVVNNTRLRGANGGTLIVETPGNDNDWDGGGAGRIIADGANVELRDTTSFAFNGSVEVHAGRQVFANGFELEFEPGSTLTLTNGVYQSTHATNFGGALVVNAGDGSVIQTGDTLIFDTGGTVTLAGDLGLENELTIVQVGVAFSGAGKLINGQDRVIAPDGTASIDVLFENHGTHAVAGTAIGRNDFVDYIQAETGRLAIGVNGTGIGAFDRMFVDGQIQLAGALDLSLGGGYMPALNDLITIISAPGGVLGAFAEVNQPAGMPAGLLFDVDYNDIQFVRLRVVSAPIYSADFDLDGDVDSDDLKAWRSSFGVNDGADADDDNDSDGADFLAWQQQLGSVPAAPAADAVPEPGGVAMGLVTTFSFAASVRGRRLRRPSGRFS